MNTEMVERLWESFHTEKALGGRRTAALLRLLGELVKFYQGNTNRDDEWLDDRGKFNLVVDGWNRHLEEIKPKESEADRKARQEGPAAPCLRFDRNKLHYGARARRSCVAFQGCAARPVPPQFDTRHCRLRNAHSPSKLILRQPGP